MGIVFKQSLKNTLILFLGFGIGGINVLFLYTHFLDAAYFGLITFLLSSANLLMPLMVFGMQHTVVKFYSAYSSREERDDFLITALVLPVLVIVPFALIGTAFYNQIAAYLSRENIIIEKYTYLIFLLAVFMGYFEVFYSWSRVHMRSVYGNFIKEVFARISVTFLLATVHFGWLSSEQFVYAVVVVYAIRVLLMQWYALQLYKPRWKGFRLPGNLTEILHFSMYIILAGSAGTILLEIDKFMIPQLKEISQVAYYSVGVYIASVIAIPSRAMQQIINPITAKELNDNNTLEVGRLYRKSSLNLFAVGGLFFLLINVNIRELYDLIDKPEYNVGIYIVLIVSLAELIKLSLGNNGAILTNSKYYRVLFYYAIGMAASVVVLNRLLIDLLGISGAALATLAVVAVFSLLKLYYVYVKMGMQPYTRDTARLFLLIGSLFAAFYFLALPVHPLLAIGLKSLLVTAIFVFVMLKMGFSEEINRIWKKYLNP